MKCLMGIDVGTTGTKVCVYSETGKNLERAYRSYELRYSLDRVEIDPEIWWSAVCECIREILEDGSICASDIVSVGVSSTNALIILDNDHKLLTTGIMQLDQRASGLVRVIERDLGDDFVGEITGNRIVSGAFWGPTLLWLRINLPQTFGSARYFLCPHSYIVYKLTNEYTIDHSRAATTMLYDIRGHAWNDEMCGYFGIDKRLLPPIHMSDAIAGEVTTEAGRETGLSLKTKVICGCMDSAAAQIGLGCLKNQADALVIGTVGRFCIESVKYDLRFMTTTSLDTEKYLVMSPINAAGLSHRWLKKILFTDRVRAGTTDSDGSDEYQEMDKAALESTPGANGIIYHPYLAGERSPIWNPNAKGSYIGLTSRNTRSDIIRATLEGTGYALYQNMLIIENDLDHAVHLIHAGGGGSRSPVWMQILSDILGKEIRVPIEEDVETLGIAILSGEAVHVFKDIGAGIAQCVKIGKKFHPSSPAHSYYMRYFDLYRKFYGLNRDFYDSLAKMQQGI